MTLCSCFEENQMKTEENNNKTEIGTDVNIPVNTSVNTSIDTGIDTGIDTVINTDIDTSVITEDITGDETPMPEIPNLLLTEDYFYNKSCVVYEGKKKINTKEYHYQRVYYMPCEKNTEYVMQCFKEDMVVFLGSAPRSPEDCGEENSLTAIMSNRVNGKPIDRILTVTTGENDKYLIFAFNTDELGLLSFPTEIDRVYEGYISNTVIKKGDSFSICGYSSEGYTHDPDYKSEYIQNAVKKSEMLSRILWTPKKNMPSMNGVFSPDKPSQGFPYSSVKGYNKFVGVDVLPETFLTCLENPNGILYSYNCNEVAIKNYSMTFDSTYGKNVCSTLGKVYESIGQQNASCYYGTVCSSLVGYAIGLPYYETTYSFANKDMEEVPMDLNKVRSGDIVVQFRSENGGGHTVIILDVEKDPSGEVKYITYSESNYSNCHLDRVTADEFVLRFLKESSLNTYSIAKIFRYSGIENNTILEYSGKAFTEKNGKSILVLDKSVDRVGCVFIDGKEFFDYTYDLSTHQLVLDISSKSIESSTVKLSRSDMDRAYLTQAKSYNYGGGAIALDRGNKSVYSVNDDIVITLFAGKGVDGVEILREGMKELSCSFKNSVDMGNQTHTLTIEKGTLESGYYTVNAVDKNNKILGTQELMVYGDSVTVITNGYSDKGIIIPEDNMIKGKVQLYDGFLTPMYVSRVGITGVVYDTAPINSDGSFEISCGSDATQSYIKIHYLCNYGRVATPAFRVFYGKACD